MRRLFTGISIVIMLLGFTRPARAQSTVEVSQAQVSYLFGTQITFSAYIHSSSPIQETLIFFQSEGDANTLIGLVAVDETGMAVYQHPLAAGSLRPFAPVYFWYRVTLTTGEVYTSPKYFFEYIDNRYPWQTIEDDLLRVHWYSGDVAFGQEAFDVAHVGMQKISTVLPFGQSPPIDIYIYASATDLQNVLALGGQAWAVGQASPDLGVALVSISPEAEQGIEMERQIPHELAHVLLYQRAGQAYERLPVWLREGIASMVEIYPNPDYRLALEAAGQNGTLMEMTSLCTPFPADAGRAFLAYAEADSFTRYLYNTYGSSGLFNLILAYADGLDCEQGARRALGVTLTQLDHRWRQSALGGNAGGVAVQNILPYLILLGIILIVPIWLISVHLKRKTNDNTKPKPS